ncbi:hypothetical protein GCM10010377_66670 [Streptomyces viridiviolaceus]|uniref:Uncharacterized protein n=1 Tax=Streptomyces viridiviolaceus TaxID=68282 RepID=A0ABW2EDX3_9ACTN|nr:hypothetical protein [Streptomyces viridiviolaceus]GHB66386.1 hypothetical protein GCM10010377_66670 [Streptomyces viridiviolaceus]
MSGDKDPRNRRDDRFTRARDEDEPGAHSGAESQARQRTVPGTASAEEGYQPDRGTTAGEPLEGVETRDAARPEASRENRSRENRDEKSGD